MQTSKEALKAPPTLTARLKTALSALDKVKSEMYQTLEWGDFVQRQFSHFEHNSNIYTGRDLYAQLHGNKFVMDGYVAAYVGLISQESLHTIILEEFTRVPFHKDSLKPVKPVKRPRAV